MPNQIKSTLAGAPTTGAASAGTAELAVVTGLTHSVTTSRLSGDIGSGVLVSGVGAACTFRIGPATGGTAPFAADEYCTISFKVRARVELPGSLPADSTINGHQLMGLNSPGFILYLTNIMSGLRFYLAQFVTGANYQPVYDSIPYGEWLEITLRIKKSAQGCAELFVNGANTSTVTGDFSALGATLLWNWPALAGCAWEFAGNFEQWSGTDYPIGLKNDVRDPLDEIQRYFVVYGDSRIHPDNVASGRDALVTTVSGSPAYTYQAVSTGGNNPRQAYVTVTGSGAVERRVYEGELDFSEGWAGLYFPMLYLPSGTTAFLDLYRDSYLLRRLELRNDAIYCNSAPVVTFSSAARNGLAIMVGQSGELDVIAADQTTTSVASPYVYTRAVQGWNQSYRYPPNRWQLETTLGASGFQACGAVFFNTLRVTGVDSMVAGLAFATPIPAPGYQVGSNITAARYLNEVLAIPGIRPFSVSRSGGRHCAFNLGRSGQTYAQWITNVVTPLSAIRGGVKLAIYEGGINDIGGVATLADAKTAVDNIANCDRQVLAWSKAKPGRRVVIGSIIERSLSTHWALSPANSVVGARLSAIRQANINRRAIFAPTVGARHAFIDVGGMIRPENHAAMIDTANPPHFTTAGCDLYYSNFSAGETAVTFDRN